MCFGLSIERVTNITTPMNINAGNNSKNKKNKNGENAITSGDMIIADIVIVQKITLFFMMFSLFSG